MGDRLDHSSLSFPSFSFLVLGGYTDFIVPSVFANAHGAITGLANIAPYAIKSLMDSAFASVPLSTSTLAKHGSPTQLLRESQRLQGVIAKADRTVALTSVAGTKWLLRRLDPETYPEGAEEPRRPLSRTADEVGERLLAHADVKALLLEELKLKQVAGWVN